MPDLNFQVESAEPERFAAEPLLVFKLRVSEPHEREAGANAHPRRGPPLPGSNRAGPAALQAAETGAAARPLRHAGSLGADGPAHALDPRRHLRTAILRRLRRRPAGALAAPTSTWRPRNTSRPWTKANSLSASSSAEQSSTRTAMSPCVWPRSPGTRRRYFRLPAATWRGLMEQYYSNTAWLSLRKDVFDRLARYRSRQRPALLGAGRSSGCSPQRRPRETMNRALVDPIADAVLYEGYILYPYRPSVKNRQRWTFGGLYPEAYCQATGGRRLLDAADRVPDPGLGGDDIRGGRSLSQPDVPTGR